MTTAAVPRRARDLDAAWLSDALGPVSGGARVVDVSARRIGNGMVSDSVRLRLTWDRPNPAPATVVAKVPAASDASRAAAAATRTYLIEAAFYSELGPTLAVNRPACHLARYDAATGDYVVLLEDLAPAEAGDQLDGCSADAAAAVVPELAALHGCRWDDRTLGDLAWLDRPSGESAQATADFVGSLFPQFVSTYGDRVDPEVLALAERFVPAMGAYLAHRPGPWTVVHGDFRLDNLLFGPGRVAVVDWQTVRLGPALSDVSYFLGSALLPADRRAHEIDLVGEYHRAVVAAGADLSWDDCWRDYRRFAFDGLIMGMAASVLVTSTERGDAMFMAMVNRHGRQVLDLDTESLVGSGD